MIIAGAFLLLPVLAHAQTAGSGENSTLGNVIWAVVPFLVIGFFLFWFIRKIQSPSNPRIRKYDEHMAREVQHMERVEQNLERIIKALEKKD